MVYHPIPLSIVYQEETKQVLTNKNIQFWIHFSVHGNLNEIWTIIENISIIISWETSMIIYQSPTDVSSYIIFISKTNMCNYCSMILR